MDSNQVIPPILMQRQCDGGRGDMTPEELAEWTAKRLLGEGRYIWGCGTRFQWWWGSNAVCPTCGMTYLCDIEALKRYRLPQIAVFTDGERPSAE